MRDVASIETAIRAVMSSRADKAVQRDRQWNNVRLAFVEVDRLEGAMDRDLVTLENLFKERDAAREAQELDAALVGP